jgi:acetyl-CoA acyltransferase
MSTLSATAIVGVGMTCFGKHIDRSLKSLAAEAVDAALADAHLEREHIDAAFVANSMAAIITGQVAVVGQTILRDYGFSGIPVYNIDNACASSSSALNLAVHAILAGAANTVLVLGVEKLMSSDKSKAYIALNGAADTEFVAASGIDPTRESVFVASVYPERLAAYSQAFGLDERTLAAIAVKNRGHAATNEHAQYRKPISMDDVLASRHIVGPITALMCAPIGDGAAAVIVTRADLANSNQHAVTILASAIGMGASPSANSSAIRTVAARAYKQAGVSAADIHVAEVHDSIAFNELLAYEELGFAASGKGARLVLEGETTLGGRLPVNPSGGLESRGHPVAATGLGQICELVWQLRGKAGARQVKGASKALAENAGGFAKDDTAAIAVTILSS